MVTDRLLGLWTVSSSLLSRCLIQLFLFRLRAFFSFCIYCLVNFGCHGSFSTFAFNKCKGFKAGKKKSVLPGNLVNFGTVQDNLIHFLYFNMDGIVLRKHWNILTEDGLRHLLISFNSSNIPCPWAESQH